MNEQSSMAQVLEQISTLKEQVGRQQRELDRQQQALDELRGPSLAGELVAQPQAPSGLIVPNSAVSPQAGGIGRRKVLKRVSLGMMAGLSATLPLTSAVLADSPTPPHGPVPTQAQAGHPASPRSGAVAPTVASNSNTQTYVGCDFKPINSATGYSWQAGVNNASGIFWTGGGDTDFLHRIQLPQGAKLTFLELYYTDNDSGSSRLKAGLFVYDNSGGLTIPVSLSSTSAAGGIRALSQSGTPASPIVTIDNYNYSYQLFFQSGVANFNHTFYGAFIRYTNVTGTFKAE